MVSKAECVAKSRLKKLVADARERERQGYAPLITAPVLPTKYTKLFEDILRLQGSEDEVLLDGRRKRKASSEPEGGIHRR